MKSMLIAASLTGVLVAGLLFTLKKQRQKSLKNSGTPDERLDGQPVRSMQFTMG